MEMNDTDRSRKGDPVATSAPSHATLVERFVSTTTPGGWSRGLGRPDPRRICGRKGCSRVHLRPRRPGPRCEPLAT